MLPKHHHLADRVYLARQAEQRAADLERDTAHGLAAVKLATFRASLAPQRASIFPHAPIVCPQCRRTDVRHESKPCPACGWLAPDVMARTIASLTAAAEDACERSELQLEMAEAHAAGVFDAATQGIALARVENSTNREGSER